jgi:pilus assembly protein CpaF
MADLLSLAVRSRRSILVSGEPAAARAALLSALQREVDPSDVVVVLGDGNPSDAAATTISPAGAGTPQRALGAALRLGPDRLVVTEDAAAVALEALAALPGTLAGLAGSSGADAISRLVTQARLSGGTADAEAVRDGIASELQLVATVGRGSDGKARVIHIAELERLDARGRATLKDIFVHKNDGTFAATGHVPGFAEGAASALFKN